MFFTKNFDFAGMQILFRKEGNLTRTAKILDNWSSQEMRSKPFEKTGKTYHVVTILEC